MSNISLNREDLLEVKDLIENVKRNGLSYEDFIHIFNIIAPKKDGVMLINNSFLKDGNDRIMFVPRTRSIIGSFDMLEKWVMNNIDLFSAFENIRNDDVLKVYLKLFVLAHEIEHSYQYLASRGEYSTGVDLVDSSYSLIFGLFNKDNGIIPRPIKRYRKTISCILYYNHSDNYFLERNANIDAFQFTSFISRECGDDDISSVFLQAKKRFSCIGYLKNGEGCIKETFRELLMADKFKKIYRNCYLYSICDEEKVRLGLPIDNEIRKKVLKLEF